MYNVVKKMVQTDKKGISIVITCYNSEFFLPKTLEHLAKQEIRKDIPVELLIINNVSTDNTKEVAGLEWKKYNSDFLFRMVDEEKPGVLFARQRGVTEAQYEYILCCDHDNYLQSDYAQRAYDIMESNEKIGALGGQSVAISDVDFPDWFSDYQSWYAVGEQANNSGDVTHRRYVWSAGMMTRRSLLLKVFNDKYPFITQGRTENNLLSGEDSEMCRRMMLIGYKLYYDKSLLFYHFMTRNRLNWVYLKNLLQGIEHANILLKKYDLILAEKNKSLIRKILSILYHILQMIKQRNSTVQLKTELYAKVTFMLRSAKLVKDSDYQIIIRFFLENK